jgi:tRNA (mo5U34)-methyltransferase
MAGGDSAPLTRAEIESGVAAIDWYHSIPLGHGIVTPGSDRPMDRLDRMGIPPNLRGKTVLDIGAWDGFFSFEAERRGAARVVATDSHAWRDRGKGGFEFARRALGSKVEDRDLDVMELSPESVGVFDLVLFLGVLYHMKDPLAGLECVASVSGNQVIVATAVDLIGMRRPAAAFYPGREFSDDPTNWWGPNPPAVLAMLRTVGFRRAVVHTKPYPALGGRVVRAAKHRVRRGDPFTRIATQAWAVFHAWK